MRGSGFRGRGGGVLPFFCSCSWPVPLWASAIHSRWAPGTPAKDQELRTAGRKERGDAYRGLFEDSRLWHRSPPTGPQHPALKSWERGHKAGYSTGSATGDPGVKCCPDLSTRRPCAPQSPVSIPSSGPSSHLRDPGSPGAGTAALTSRPPAGASRAGDDRARAGEAPSPHPRACVLPANTEEHVGSPDQWKDRREWKREGGSGDPRAGRLQ